MRRAGCTIAACGWLVAVACGGPSPAGTPAGPGPGPAAAGVSIADAGLELAVRGALGRPDGPLDSASVAAITALDASGRDIAVLDGAGCLSSLALLDLSDNRLHDITPLASLARLTHLNLAGNEVADITPLGALDSLSDLVLDGNPVGSLEPLLHLTRLQSVSLLQVDLSAQARTAELAQLRQAGVQVVTDAPEPGAAPPADAVPEDGIPSGAADAPPGGLCSSCEQRLAYYRWNSSTSRLYTMAEDGSDQSIVVAPADLAVAWPGFTWSPDGSTVAVQVSEQNHPVIRFLDLLTGQLVAVGGTARLPGRYPAWHPSGASLLFEDMSGPAGTASVLASLDAQSGTVTPVVPAAWRGAFATWSPDGARIAYVASDRKGGFSLWVMDAAGQGVTLLVEVAGFGRPAWSPDGSRIAFGRDGSGFLYTVGVETGQVQQLTAGPGLDSDPAWSPGGGRIAFSRAAFGRHIWVVASAGGTPRRLTQDPDNDAAPAWIVVDGGS